MPEALRKMDIKQYATYYTTRKDNAWAKEHPDEMQQMYLMSDFVTAKDTCLRIKIMEHFYKDQFKVNPTMIFTVGGKLLIVQQIQLFQTGILMKKMVMW